MKLGIRGRLLGAILLLSLGTILISGIYLDQLLGSWLERRITLNLVHLANVGKGYIQQVEGERSITKIDSLSDILGINSEVRITVIDRNGRVLGDSKIDSNRIHTMDNHGNRPEFIQAIERGQGLSKRYSQTLRTQMLYVGVSYRDQNEIGGVVRASLSLQEVEQTRYNLRWLFILSLILSLVIATSASGLLAHLATRRLRLLLARVDSLVPSPPYQIQPDSRKDEIDDLEESFEQLSQQLENRMEQIGLEQNRMNAVLEGLDEGVVVLDKDNRIGLFNKRASEVLGTGTLFLNDSIDQSVMPSLLAGFIEETQQSGAPNTTQLSLNDEYGEREVLVWFTPARDQKSWVLVLRDITAFYRMEKVRQDFVANVSHELLTPVSVIQASAETLQDHAKDDPKMGAILTETIYTNSQLLSQIFNDLLELSKLDQDKERITLQPVFLSQVVEYVIDFFSSSVVDKELVIHVEVEPSHQVLADVRCLERVVFNLVDNAIKYVPHQSSITVRSLPVNKSTMQLEIIDNGPGIPLQHHSRIFERFYRVDPDRSRNKGGTGLGLAIVKQLIEKMGGNIRLLPEQPNGCRFIIEIATKDG